MLSEAFIGKAGEKKPPGRGVFQTGTKHLSRMIKVQDSLGTSVTLFFVMSYLRSIGVQGQLFKLNAW